MRKRRLICGLVALLMMALAGCGAARPSKYYSLTVPGDGAQAADPNAYPVTILVGALTAPNLYRGDRIVYSTSGMSMGTYEYQRWAEPPTEMMQEIMLRQLRASGRFRQVSSLRTNSRGDYFLQGRLYDFKEVSKGPLVARVAVEYELREAKTGETVWSHYYAHDEPVSEKSVTAVVEALDRNAQNIISEARAGLEQYFSTHPVTPAAPAQ
jgi:cholesterol transport system auxiliary component